MSCSAGDVNGTCCERAQWRGIHTKQPTSLRCRHGDVLVCYALGDELTGDERDGEAAARRNRDARNGEEDLPRR
jgi:hypothetical protein